jgi:transposase
VLLFHQRVMLEWGECQAEHRHVQQSNSTVTTMGIDIGKNSFHVVGLDQRGAIVLRQKWSRGTAGDH